MTPIVSYELTNEDRELLKTRLPERPYEYDHHDYGFCGSPACDAYEKALKPYKEANLLDFMFLKERLIETVSRRDSSPSQIIAVIDDFKKQVPNNVAEAMSLGFDIDLYYGKFQEIENEIVALHDNLIREMYMAHSDNAVMNQFMSACSIASTGK